MLRALLRLVSRNSVAFIRDSRLSLALNVHAMIFRVGAMNRMHQRMRVVFIVVGSATFFGFFYGLESFNNDRIMRDRLRGDPTVGG